MRKVVWYDDLLTKEKNMTIKHLSFSGLKLWKECAFKYKISYVDKVAKFEGNAFTAFGTAMHTVCEKNLLQEWNQEDSGNNFQTEFIQEMQNLPEKTRQETDQELVEMMMDQGYSLAYEAIPALKEFFGEFEILSSEEELYEPVTNSDIKFKGFVDLVLKTKDGKIHILDWKTCGWGWDARKKVDTMTNYQLVLYKHFLSQKHKYDPKNIETYFGLLKRTAKKDKVEIFRVTSGPKKTFNALNLLDDAIHFIKKEQFMKNKTACEFCDLHRTIHCP